MTSTERATKMTRLAMELNKEILAAEEAGLHVFVTTGRQTLASHLTAHQKIVVEVGMPVYPNFE